MSLTKLTEDEVSQALDKRPDWTESAGQIQRTYQFDDFVAAIAFVSKVADYAEQAQHHPDILIRYNKVTISVSTHDVAGISHKDFDLADAVDGYVEAPAGA